MKPRRRRRSEEGRRHVDHYTATELHTFLVEDAVVRHATDLQWAVEAYERIGRLRGCGAELAFIAVVDEVETRTGLRHMPVAG